MKYLVMCSRFGNGLKICVFVLAVILGQVSTGHGQNPAVAPIAQTPVRAQNAPSLLPGNGEIRNAAAIAASVVPPKHAASDISRLAGEYSYGNGFDVNCTLEISPDGRFLFKRCNCETVVDQALGQVELMENGRLVLKPQQARDSWPRGTAQVLVPVSWDQRLYLIPENDFLGFSNHVNRGLEPVSRGSMGSYYLREGDWDRPATGKPDLPDEWQERLLDEPIAGQVAGRDPSGRWIINLGEDHGLYNGMQLSAWSRDLRKFVTLMVTEMGTHTSAVKILSAPLNLPIQGWTVYSKITPPRTVPTPEQKTLN